jgi:hypothetical protein
MKTLRSIALLLVLLAAAVPAAATVLLRQEVEDLARLSENIVHARVIDIASRWNGARTMIETDVTLDVIRDLRGASRRHPVIVVPGGWVDGYRQVVDGAPRFHLDDEVVVFVRRDAAGRLRVTGMVQGLSRVARDEGNNIIFDGGAAHGLRMDDLERRLPRGASRQGRR